MKLPTRPMWHTVADQRRCRAGRERTAPAARPRARVGPASTMGPRTPSGPRHRLLARGCGEAHSRRNRPDGNVSTTRNTGRALTRHPGIRPSSDLVRTRRASCPSGQRRAPATSPSRRAPSNPGPFGVRHNGCQVTTSVVCARHRRTLMADIAGSVCSVCARTPRTGGSNSKIDGEWAGGSVPA